MQKIRIFMLDFSVHLTPAAFIFQTSTVRIISISKYNIAFMDWECKRLLQRCASLKQCLWDERDIAVIFFQLAQIWRCFFSHHFCNWCKSMSSAYLTLKTSWINSLNCYFPKFRPPSWNHAVTFSEENKGSEICYNWKNWY